jgi:transposase InsO family protein
VWKLTAQVLPAERADCAAAFLRQALAYYTRRGTRIKRLMTDNGKVFDWHLFVQVCQQHGIKHLHTRPYRPPDQRQS